MSPWDDEPPQDQLFVWEPRDLTDQEREDFRRILQQAPSPFDDPEWVKHDNDRYEAQKRRLEKGHQ